MGGDTPDTPVSSVSPVAPVVVVNPAQCPVCRVCGDLGYVRRDVPLGHPDFGRAIRCACRADEDRARQASRAQAASNLNGRLLTKTFASFDCDRAPNGENACRVLRAFADGPDGWVLILGNRGTGKTHLLAAVANALIAQGQPAHMPLYVVVPDFLDYLRGGYDSDQGRDQMYGRVSENASRRMADARECPVLLLDDLGVEKRSTWTDEQMYRLLNHRYNEGLPTVIASNVTPDELEPRIASRMRDRELARIVTLSGEDQRVVSR